ncbi:MAG: DUF2237 domain-containing protein [Saprospiraceae bacterium]|nr:DUF2237 domain-containing protein [Saprospiraceae bacterium]
MKKSLFFLFMAFSTVSFAQNKAKTVTKLSPSSATCAPVQKTSKLKIMENKVVKYGKNILGTDLEIAGTEPITGYYRDGFCSSGAEDRGVHVVAAVMTDEFLKFSKSRGNDLITPFPAYGFPGLKVNDKWCLCASRWKEAYDAGVAPPVILAATHEKALEFATLEQLKEKKSQ